MALPDGKSYYGYLFETDKKPSKVLDALLRGIANYISDSIGASEEKHLTPSKLAGFYKAVGGNYDSLFVDVPHPSISWIYASIGCQHTLQPTKSDYDPPTVPSLTTKGFVRWQSIEILLGPEEHVPFMQNAVRNFGIKNPDTGETFPIDLPKEAFPQLPDTEIEKWHTECAARLRERATPDADHITMRPDLPPRPKVQTGYAHVRIHRPARPESDFIDRSRVSTRPVSYSHVPSTSSRPVRPLLSRSPSHRARQFLAPEEPILPRVSRSRRQSFPENYSSSTPSSPNAPPPEPEIRQPENPHMRRHSHPRQAEHGSNPSDASSESDGPPSPTIPAPRRRSHPAPRARVDDEPESPRFAPAVPIPTGARHRSRERRDVEDELKRRTYQIPMDTSGKLSAPFLLGKRDKEKDRERERDRVRDPRSNSRAKLSWKDLSNVTDLWNRGSKESSQDEGHPRPRDSDYKRRERERERERDQDNYRERDRERERGSRVHSRKSSHEDVTKRNRDRDRDRERDRERDGRERERDSGSSGRAKDQRSFRDRERRFASPVRGVDGRRYPSH